MQRTLSIIKFSEAGWTSFNVQPIAIVLEIKENEKGLK